MSYDKSYGSPYARFELRVQSDSKLCTHLRAMKG